MNYPWAEVASATESGSLSALCRYLPGAFLEASFDPLWYLLSQFLFPQTFTLRFLWQIILYKSIGHSCTVNKLEPTLSACMPQYEQPLADSLEYALVSKHAEAWEMTYWQEENDICCHLISHLVYVTYLTSSVFNQNTMSGKKKKKKKSHVSNTAEPKETNKLTGFIKKQVCWANNLSPPQTASFVTSNNFLFRNGTSVQLPLQLQNNYDLLSRKLCVDVLRLFVATAEKLGDM